MKKLITTLTIATLALVGCSDPNEWDGPEQRDAAFSEYACQRMTEEEPSLVGSTATSEAFDMDLTASDRASLLHHATLVTTEVAQPTCDPSSPDYHADFVQAWENAMEEQEGPDFTPQTARDHGIDVE